MTAKLDDSIECELAQPNAISQNPNPIAGKWRHMGERLSRGKQFVEIVHAE